MTESKNPVEKVEKRGNPAWRKGGPSPNPSGRPKVDQQFRLRCRHATEEIVFAAWLEEVVNRGPEWLRCSRLLAAYGHGLPSQSVDVTVTTRVEELSTEELLAEVRSTREALTTTH